MSLYDRFELLNLDRDDGVKTFEAREISTGRPVKVHLFIHSGAPLQAALLKEIDRLPEGERQRIIDRGKHEGTPYLVTDRLPEYPGLSEWVQAAGRQARPANPAMETAGAWKVPASAAKPSAPSSPAPGSPPSLNKQFAELFTTAERPVLPETAILSPPKPAAVAPPPSPRPVPAAQPPSAPAAKEPGEFTRMFQSPVTASPAPVAPTAPAPPAAKEPGEFTRMFQAPVTGQTAAPASKDFENYFEPSAPAGPMPHSPAVQQPLTPQAPGSTGPNRAGEFTRMFGKIDGPMQPTPPAAPAGKEPGAFTRMFQTPIPSSNPAPSAPASPPTPAAPPPAMPAVMPAAPPPAPPSFGKPPGPGEYTRQFSAPAQLTFGQGAPPASAAPTHETPHAPFGTMPAITTPAIPSAPAMPSAPTLPSSPVAVDSLQKNNVPLLVGIGVIVLVAIVIIVFFALRPK